jgi:hypothetical protein
MTPDQKLALGWIVMILCGCAYDSWKRRAA